MKKNDLIREVSSLEENNLIVFSESESWPDKRGDFGGSGLIRGVTGGSGLIRRVTGGSDLIRGVAL